MERNNKLTLSERFGHIEYKKASIDLLINFLKSRIVFLSKQLPDQYGNIVNFCQTSLNGEKNIIYYLNLIKDICYESNKYPLSKCFLAFNIERRYIRGTRDFSIYSYWLRGRRNENQSDEDYDTDDEIEDERKDTDDVSIPKTLDKAHCSELLSEIINELEKFINLLNPNTMKCAFDFDSRDELNEILNYLKKYFPNLKENEDLIDPVFEAFSRKTNGEKRALRNQHRIAYKQKMEALKKK